MNNDYTDYLRDFIGAEWLDDEYRRVEATSPLRGAGNRFSQYHPWVHYMYELEYLLRRANIEKRDEIILGKYHCVLDNAGRLLRENRDNIVDVKDAQMRLRNPKQFFDFIWELEVRTMLSAAGATASFVNPSSGNITRYVPTKAIFEQKAQDLEQQFRVWFDSIIKSKDSIGIFAMAPQPLLFKLGTLINDQYNTVAFQCHRNGHKWAWPEKSNMVEFSFKCSKEGISNKVALVMDLSAAVLDDRIEAVLGEETSIFHITLEKPCRTFVTSESIQNAFVDTFRTAMEHIKNLRPAPTEIHIFPVMPVSLVIRAGMDYMPKADLPVILYEQANQSEGFFEALTIGK